MMMMMMTWLIFLCSVCGDCCFYVFLLTVKVKYKYSKNVRLMKTVSSYVSVCKSVLVTLIIKAVVCKDLCTLKQMETKPQQS